MPTYDYSQPIVINTYNTPSADASADASPQQTATQQQESPETTAGYQSFDAAREAFIKQDYRQALTLDEEAVAQIPSDPVLHEFGALCLYALGRYDQAAAVLNAVLAVAPGMDWASMSSLYPNIDTYTQQLRALEDHTQKAPGDASAHFVLAYHYLVAGHSDAAIEQLQAVLKTQPKDEIARRMLDALQPPEETASDTSQATPPTPDAATPETEPAGPTTDLVGNWRAERDGDVFELSISEEAEFTWKAIPKNGTPVEIAGPMATTDDTMILESTDQGTMVAQVKSGGADEFQFAIAGGPPDDKGLTFLRVN